MLCHSESLLISMVAYTAGKSSENTVAVARLRKIRLEVHTNAQPTLYWSTLSMQMPVEKVTVVTVVTV